MKAWREDPRMIVTWMLLLWHHDRCRLQMIMEELAELISKEWPRKEW